MPAPVRRCFSVLRSHPHPVCIPSSGSPVPARAGHPKPTGQNRTITRGTPSPPDKNIMPQEQDKHNTTKELRDIDTGMRPVTIRPWQKPHSHAGPKASFALPDRASSALRRGCDGNGSLPARRRRRGNDARGRCPRGWLGGSIDCAADELHECPSASLAWHAVV